MIWKLVVDRLRWNFYKYLVPIFCTWVLKFANHHFCIYYVSNDESNFKHLLIFNGHDSFNQRKSKSVRDLWVLCGTGTDARFILLSLLLLLPIDGFGWYCCQFLIPVSVFHEDKVLEFNRISKDYIIKRSEVTKVAK